MSIDGIPHDIVEELRRLQQENNFHPKKAKSSGQSQFSLGNVAFANDDSREHLSLDIGELNTPSNPSPSTTDDEQHRPGRLYALIPGRLSFTAHESEKRTKEEIESQSELFFFSTDLQESDDGDWRHLTLASLVRFCDYLRDMQTDKRLMQRHLVYYCTDDAESISNTALLLSAYLLLEHGFSPTKALAPFKEVNGLPIQLLHKTNSAQSASPMTTLDFLQSLYRAVGLGWFNVRKFNADRCEELERRDDVIHLVCPKFIGFRSLRRYSRGALSSDDGTISELQDLGASKVVRLSESEPSRRRKFEAAGLQLVELCESASLRHCATPSDQVVGRFLAECAASAVVAMAGEGCAQPGRAGTMVALWLMNKDGFTAKEAMAWLQLTWPGAIAESQHKYLQWMEGRIRFGCFKSASPADHLPPPGSSPLSLGRLRSAASHTPVSRALSSASSLGSASASLSEQVADKLRRIAKRR